MKNTKKIFMIGFAWLVILMLNVSRANAADPMVTYGSLFEFYYPSSVVVNDSTHFHVLQNSKSYAFTASAADVSDCVSKGQSVVSDHSTNKLKISVSGQTSSYWNMTRCAKARK